MISPAQAAAHHLRAARAALEDAAVHIGETNREDSALLAEHCDRLAARALEVERTVEDRTP